MLSLFWEHKQQSYTLNDAKTLFAHVLCCIQLKKKFFSLRLRSGLRLGSKYFSYASGFRSQHQASALYPAGVTMQLFKTVGIIACSTHPEWLNGNRSPQWEIIAFTGTYGPQPLSGYKSVYLNISWRGQQNRIER